MREGAGAGVGVVVRRGLLKKRELDERWRRIQLSKFILADLCIQIFTA